MRRRLVTSLLLVVVGLPAILLGGGFFFLTLSVFLVGAAWEYVQLFRAVRAEPQQVISVAGVGLLLAARMYWPAAATPALAALVLAALAYHLIAYERGRDQAALDFGVTVGALAYLGWVGAYLLDIRNLRPDGGWWFMLVMLTLWLVDAGAYSLGAAYGKHTMTPRLSPKKSWEGFAAGVFTGMIAGAFLAYAFSAFGNLRGDITPAEGGLLGLVLGLTTPFGDLGESMIKRQSGAKDSGNILPGHGGFFDRIDSWLWGGFVGYCFLAAFVL